jgi:large conductance mechanosensitive channel
MLKEFKEFAVRGNVVDMAVGIVIGVAFGGIIKSLVADVIMPPIGLLLGGVNFSDIFINLSGGDYESLAAAKEAGAATLNVGVFFNTLLNFVIVAFAIFILIRAINKMKRKEEQAPEPEATTKDCPFCYSAIPIKATRCGNCTSELKTA